MSETTFPENLVEFASLTDYGPEEQRWVYSDSGNIGIVPSYIREQRPDESDYPFIDNYHLMCQISPSRAFYSLRSIGCICMAYPYNGMWFLDSSFFDIDSSNISVTFSSEKPLVVNEESRYKIGDSSAERHFMKLGKGMLVHFELEGDFNSITTGFESNEDYMEWKLSI